MFQNKWFNLVNIVIGLSLAVVAVLTVRSAVVTSALADRRYDSIEQVRLDRSAVPTAAVDQSYDNVEKVRADRSAQGADHSYDFLEHLRLDRLSYLVDQGHAALVSLSQALLPAPPAADRSYDQVERIRLERTDH